MYAQPHPLNQAARRSFAVTPAHVAGYVRDGLAAGWLPLEPGPQFVLEHPDLRVRHELLILPRGRRRLGAEELAALATSSHRDRFELRDVPSVSWRGKHAYRPCGVAINGRDFLELIAAVEHPLVAAEFELRREAGEEIAEANFAGEYLPRFPAPYQLAGGVGSAEVRAFETDDDDPRRIKTTLLTCTCGIDECWFLLANIRVLDDIVVWSDFEQFHRDWVYDLGPFVFDKQAYFDSLGIQMPG
ncbi:hypothetical protein DB30_06124 [Enhygromyxa salina]|uniref:Uncharacterized protein n=1 Tax=Enhygromyxa salina TaxID=215803 RepID=A0A0C2D4V0_9BACT|nr:hypothetical protein DB30_06124 [Enhygromyxa salina]